MDPVLQATAFAPATVANVAVGFDVLGFAFDGCGDRVTVRRQAAPGVTIAAVEGVEVPRDPASNTAGKALLEMGAALCLDFGFEVSLAKGIPMSSGLGGSAASAVGAVVAANALLERPCGCAELYPFALAGEAVASGAMHGDNVAPGLFGGMVLVLPGAAESPPVALPVPEGLQCVLARVHVALDTKSQRAVLPDSIPLGQHAEQSAWLAGVVSALHAGDLDLLARCLHDVVVGPHRSAAIPGYDAMAAAANAAGALGFGIAGSGPTVFAFVTETTRVAVESAIRAAAQAHASGVDLWTGAVGTAGARLETQ